jgi:hypothetical protein
MIERNTTPSNANPHFLTPGGQTQPNKNGPPNAQPDEFERIQTEFFETPLIAEIRKMQENRWYSFDTYALSSGPGHARIPRV